MANILIVDDSANSRLSLAALLDGKGHRVIEADQGAQALDFARANAPDLVITDGLMPVMDGYEMVRRLRSEPPLARTPVIYYTAAYPDAAARSLAEAHGVSHFLVKPATPEALIEAVNSALSSAAKPVPVDGAELVDRHLRFMTDKLHQKFAELETLSGKLDKRVTERTAELAAQNAKLVEEVRTRRRTESRLQAMVDRDSLTGLYNRRYFEQAVSREIARAKRGRASFGVLFADADHFKELNDAHGHAAGDAVLVTLGRHLQSCVRAEDIVCRYGGEEFVVLLVRANRDGIVVAAERMRNGVISLRVQGFGQTLSPPTLSIGTAVWPEHGHDGEALMRAADAALYRAKRAGRNRVEVAELGGA
jgi:diguanylate cyclase (GGDEF)-like protein